MGEHSPAGEPADEHAGGEVHTLDAKGLACPMPVIELARLIEQVAVGDLVQLEATDPAARVDVPVWCRMQRQTLREQQESDGVWSFLVERAR